MKIRIALAALAAVATLTLTACGTETAGTAAPVAGADRVSSAPEPAGSAGSTNTDATATDGTPTQNPPTDRATTGQTTSANSSPTPGGDSTAAAGADACAKLLTLAQDFSSKIVQKAAQGGVNQADVDEVFSDANIAALPQELRADAATLKDLSQQMVGKKITELTDILPKVQTTFQSIVEKAGSLC